MGESRERAIRDRRDMRYEKLFDKMRDRIRDVVYIPINVNTIKDRSQYLCHYCCCCW